MPPEALNAIQTACLGVAALIGAVTLLAWLIPGLGSILPSAWVLMKANTALAALLSAASLVFAHSRQSRRILIGRLFAVVVLLLAFTALLEYIFHFSFGIDTLLAADRESARPGRMSPQTGSSFTLLALVMLFIRARKRYAARAVDLILCCLGLLLLVVVSGYLYGALHFFGLTASTRTSLQTLVSLTLLTFVAFAQRTRFGVFSILRGTGIGSKIARIACPVILVVPFLLEAGRAAMIRTGLMSAEYSTAIVSSAAAILGFGLVLILSWRIHSLEKEIRDLSVRDELTKLYNRRGFYDFAGRALRGAQRSNAPFSVLFIDLDNLKEVNDKLGHEMGSQFLCEVAELLTQSFRAVDVLGRIGGDELAVAMVSDERGIQLALRRLEQAVALRNSEAGRQYPFSFSFGYVTSDARHPESLENLLERADKAMYATKRQKKLARQ